MIIKALIREYNGGKWGKTGEYIAIVQPQFFKNGNMKKTDFRTIEIVETIKKGYRYGNATRTESIAKVIEILED